MSELDEILYPSEPGVSAEQPANTPTPETDMELDYGPDLDFNTAVAQTPDYGPYLDSSALDSRIDALGGQLGVLRDQVGGLGGNLGDLSSRFDQQMSEFRSQGMSQADAFNAALGQVASDTGARIQDVQSALQGQIGSLTGDIGGLRGQLGGVERQVGDLESGLMDQLAAQRGQFESQIGSLSGNVGDLRGAVSDYASRLEQLGLSQEEALRTAMQQASESTGRDIADVRDAFESQIGGVYDELGGLRQDLTGDIAGLGSDIAGLRESSAQQSAMIDQLRSEFGDEFADMAERMGLSDSEIRGTIADLQSGFLDRMGQSDEEQAAALDRLRSEFGGEFADLQSGFLDRMGQSDEEQRAALEALRGEFGGDISDLESGLLQRMGQSDEEQQDAFNAAIDRVMQDSQQFQEDIFDEMGNLNQDFLDRLTRSSGEQSLALQDAINRVMRESGAQNQALSAELSNTRSGLQSALALGLQEAAASQGAGQSSGARPAETWLGGALKSRSTPLDLSALTKMIAGSSDAPEYFPYDVDANTPQVQEYAGGGKIMASPLASAAGGVPHKGSHYVQGAGGGQDDLIPAKLADGEYVFDADLVAALGDGSNKEGARRLDAMREAVRKHKRSAPTHKIPPKAKSPLAYFKEANNG